MPKPGWRSRRLVMKDTGVTLLLAGSCRVDLNCARHMSSVSTRRRFDLAHWALRQWSGWASADTSPRPSRTPGSRRSPHPRNAPRSPGDRPQRSAPEAAAFGRLSPADRGAGAAAGSSLGRPRLPVMSGWMHEASVGGSETDIIRPQGSRPRAARSADPSRSPGRCPREPGQVGDRGGTGRARSVILPRTS